MGVRRILQFTILVCLALIGQSQRVKAERWSRQVSNSEWIPLADPRVSHVQASTNSPGILATDSSQLPLTLPSSLQHQYQQQLLQLQKTQESIQKLLLLQQQLRAQQHLLQSQAILPSGFSGPDDGKQELQQQGISDLGSEGLVPPLPSLQALPPVFPPQSFLPQKPQSSHQSVKHTSNANQEYPGFPGQGQVPLRSEQEAEELLTYPGSEKAPQQEPKRVKVLSGHDLQSQQSPLSQTPGDEEEEVQLVYVPAETLAQRGQPKRGRGRKQFPSRVQHPHHHQHLHQQQQQQHQQQEQYHQQQRQQQQSSQASEDTERSNDDIYARQILQQLQKEHDEHAQLLKEDHLNANEKAQERKNHHHEEAQQREQELQKQREAEKKRKEHERLEELAKQRDLERAREAREKQRQEELERRRLAEIRAKEERRKEEERRREEEAAQREAERLAALERQKELELQRALKQQRILENQQREVNDKAAANGNRGDTNYLPLIREQQLHRQHLTETTRPKSKPRSRQRVRTNQYQEQNYRETTTPAPSPNQPPLSVYMGSASLKKSSVKVADVLKLLKDAKTIAVLDTVVSQMPQVFVGPTNLEPPTGYTKFDLPYLSSLDHNRVERRVDKLPFFVAPLSFDPPSGYSKIPFPAPHIGSVVVNNIDNESNRETDELNPSPTPLIEPNSYSVDSLDHKTVSTTPTYDSQTTASYTQESPSGQRFEPTYPPSSTSQGGSRFRFRQYYNEKPVVNTYYEDQRPSTRRHKYFEESRATTPSYQSTRVETAVSQTDLGYQSTPRYEGPLGPQVSSPRPQDLGEQLSLLSQDINQERESQRYGADQYRQPNSGDSYGAGEIGQGEINDVRSPVGPTQYNLPAELPAISPHLPGLVNSLVEKQEAKLQSSTPPTTTTTTTTTTQRPTTTTYRSRGRQRTRVTPRSRTQTTQTTSTAATRATTTERSRRPFNRSRSRFTTTTEEYRDSVYEPSKSKAPESTRHNSEHRRPSTRNQKYRGREKANQQSEPQNHNIQAQQATGFDNSQGGPTGTSATEAFLSHNQPTAPDAHPRQEQSVGPASTPDDFTRENYPQTTQATTENYPQVPLNRETALLSDDYTKSQNYGQSRPQDLHYPEMYNQPGTAFDRGSLEKTPVNGFNYQAQQNEEPQTEGILPRPKDYLHYQGKLENGEYELATTEDPRSRTTDDRYSSIYEVNPAQAQPEYAITGQEHYHTLEMEKLGSGLLDATGNEPPIFVPLPQSKQEDYELRVSSTEAPLTDATTQSTTTSTTPVIIRQRVRGRIGSRGHHDSAVQTRPRGSQDEYVRFSIVNHDSRSSSNSRNRDSSKSRPRARPHSHVSHIQTEGNDYIKIQAAHHQKQVATTTPRPTTTTTAAPQIVDDDDTDYGFIRPPNFQPVHAVEERLTTPVTYRPHLPAVHSQALSASDGASLESNLPQTQLSKNRPKYQQAPNRRPVNKATTIEPMTTTERVPLATTLLDDAVLFTGRPKSRTDESKHARIRGRIRRPGKKRPTTTTTTESVLETHNELPLDENYPRIPPSLPSDDQQALYEENYEPPQQFAPIRNGPGQYYDSTSENYPPQDFILNFGNHPEQLATREEYDQTQLASNPPRKYAHVSHTRPASSEDSQSTPTDIYGAESQWSTKLTSASFQPSFAANRVADDRGKSIQWNQYTDSAPEIITAGPDVSSVTFVVSSDLKNNQESSVQDEETTLMGTTAFGKKMNGHTEQLSATTAFTNPPTTTLSRTKTASETMTTYEAESWPMDRTDSSTEALATIDLERTTKRNPEQLPSRKGTRRRRVRVRVKPASDDFVTAESQHFNSAVNSLIQEQYKFSPIRESKVTTTEPSTTTTTTTTQRSALQDFLEEILKDDEAVSVQATSTSTELPEDMWTMSTPISAQETVSDRMEESTLIDDQLTTMSSTEIEADNERISSYVTPATLRTYDPEESTSDYEPETLGTTKGDEDLHRKKTMDEKKESKEKTKKPTKKMEPEETTETNPSTSSRFTQKYLILDNTGTTEELMSTKQVKFPKSEEDVKTFSAMIDERESTKLLKQNQVPKDGEDSDHPKNHRSHWSEVRYPSELDASEISGWSNEAKPTANPKAADPIPGIVTKTEGHNSVRTISDYVKAIFDSMKSAEEESQSTGSTEQPAVATVAPIENNRGQSEMNSVEESIVTRIESSSSSESRKSSPLGPTTKLHPADAAEPKQTTTTTTESVESSGKSSDSITSTTSSVRNTEAPVNSTQSSLGKVLRTSTTTKVSHMTEICYRGRCVMTRPKQDEHSR